MGGETSTKSFELDRATKTARDATCGLLCLFSPQFSTKLPGHALAILCCFLFINQRLTWESSVLLGCNLMTGTGLRCALFFFFLCGMNRECVTYASTTTTPASATHWWPMWSNAKQRWHLRRIPIIWCLLTPSESESISTSPLTDRSITAIVWYCWKRLADTPLTATSELRVWVGSIPY